MATETISVERFEQLIDQMDSLQTRLAEAEGHTRQPGFRAKTPLETRINMKAQTLGDEEYIISIAPLDEDPYFIAGRVLLAPRRVAAERIVQHTHRLAKPEEIERCKAEDAERRANILKEAAKHQPKTELSAETAQQFGQVVAIALEAQAKREKGNK